MTFTEERSDRKVMVDAETGRRFRSWEESK
jgi:hypothetical protein